MKLAGLKIVRVVVSLLYFLAAALLFLDFSGTCSTAFANGVTWPQLVPSVLKFLGVLSWGGAGFLAVLILTLVFGRVYCSSLCPLGTLQDAVSFAARRVGGRKYFHKSLPHNWLRYCILAGTVVFAACGSLVILDLLDPFSTFGKIAVAILRPVFLALNNASAWGLDHLGIGFLSQVPNPVPEGAALAAAVLVGGAIVWLTLLGGRLYCNIVCPVGTLLGLIAERALLRVAIDPAVCKGCQLCERVCKAGCIDRVEKTVDVSRCVVCFNCFAACPSGGLAFRRAIVGRQPAPRPVLQPSRREFLAESCAAVTGIVLAADSTKPLPVSSRPTTVRAGSALPLSPPGSLSLDHFTSTCTACHLCVAACPSRVLAPSFLDRGWSGVFQPKMDYNRGFCNYDCVTCSEICPSGAILPVTTEEKKRIQLGVAKFVKENCVVYTDETECGACSEHCPTKAVTMVPYKKLHAPEVRPDYCVGCGACEHACPTRPFKAIVVEGNAVHATAKKPETRKALQKTPAEDFPF